MNAPTTNFAKDTGRTLRAAFFVQPVTLEVRKEELMGLGAEPANWTATLVLDEAQFA